MNAVVTARPPGMGAIVCRVGVAFRVWAPNAQAVSVVGSFNGWNPEADPMEPEADGHWFAHVAEASVGDEYRFSLDTEAGRLSRIDPWVRAVTSSIGNGLIEDPEAFEWGDDQPVRPPVNRMVIYELHVGSYGAVLPGRVGTFDDAIERLDHLVQLGVNAVELMPVAEFAGDRSWGYNPAHPFAVEQAYGGSDGLRRFVRAAHARGLSVILDVVYNHFGPTDLDLWRFDGWSEHGGGGIYFYNDDRRTTPWGDTRPDYGRPEVRAYILANLASRVRDFHLDGVRVDMTPYMYTRDGAPDSPAIHEGWSLLQALRSTLDEVDPEVLLIAEDLQNNAAITAPLDAGGAGFDAQWDARFVHPVRAALITPSDEARDLRAVIDALEARDHDNPFARVIYTESHDAVANGSARVPEEIHPGAADSRESQKRATLGAALVLTAPGIPMLFQGQALLADRYFRDDVPLDWRRAEVFGGIVALFRDLIALRLDLAGDCAGLVGPHIEVFHVDEANKTVAYRRWFHGGPGDEVIVVANLSGRAFDDYVLRAPTQGVWRLRFNSDWRGYSEVFDGTESVSASTDDAGELHVGLGAWSALIYSLDEAR